jgi:hypothetical protein
VFRGPAPRQSTGRKQRKPGSPEQSDQSENGETTRAHS